MPDYIKYRRSISEELMAIRNRVRNFVSHWPEDGRYKEIILKNVLIQHLPKTISVGTGFVIGDNQLHSKQIDIIIYLNSFPPIFSIDDFVIVTKESVVGIIEVKSKIKRGEFRGIMENAHSNGELIGNHIFNGIFGYETENISDNGEHLSDKIEKPLRKYNGFVNHIAFGENLFAKLWPKSEPSLHHRDIPPAKDPHYSFYDLGEDEFGPNRKLTFGYFISNLIECVHKRCEESVIPVTLRNTLYPLETKEEYHKQGYEIVLPIKNSKKVSPKRSVSSKKTKNV